MAPRKSRNCGHPYFIRTCAGCRHKRIKKAREEASERFRADVESEVDFQKSIPILDDSARQKAEKERETSKQIWRATLKAYHGPPLNSYKAIKAENERQQKLQREFNNISARWSHIKREANITYLEWSNNKLENMSKDADLEIMHHDLRQIKLKDSITKAEGQIKKHRELNETTTGNGSMGSGSGKSTSTQGTL